MSWTNWKIGTKLAFGFGIVLAIFVISDVVTTIVGAMQVNQANYSADVLTPVRHATSTTDKYLGYADDMGAYYVMDRDDKSAAAYLAKYQQYINLVNEDVTIMNKYVDTAERKQYLANFTKDFTDFQNANNVPLGLRKAHQFDKAQLAYLRSDYSDAQKNIRALDDSYQAEITAAGKRGNMLGTLAMGVSLAFGLIAVVIGILVAVLITRSIVRPLRKAVDAAETIAAGDLSQELVVSSKDETGQLLEAIATMKDGLTKTVSQIREATDFVYTAAREIAAGNQNLSQRTEEQASSLEETASSMEELTSTVKQNDENARQANQLAINASASAVAGGEGVRGIVSMMGEISESSRKIVDIISVIDGIAFQTNILALNAAVEAARAGEQGRGFAVVAGEVRNLAQRSAQAAKEIKALINDSVAKIEYGREVVNKGGDQMDQIVDSVKRVTDIMSEIAAASKEQLGGIEQVNSAIMQMDQMTQQNAALVEEAAASAESLEEQAGKLVEGISVFKLSANESKRIAAALKSRPQSKPKAKPVVQPRELALIGTNGNGHGAVAVKNDDSDDWDTF
jgi:methyl-accepting chemotaxis protein